MPGELVTNHVSTDECNRRPLVFAVMLARVQSAESKTMAQSAKTAYVSSILPCLLTFICRNAAAKTECAAKARSFAKLIANKALASAAMSTRAENATAAVANQMNAAPPSGGANHTRRPTRTAACAPSNRRVVSDVFGPILALSIQ